MRRVASLVLLWVAAGCEGVARMPPARGGLDAGVVAPVDTTFWLHQSEPLELPEMSWTLPVSAGPRLHVTTARGEVLVGGADGLHQLLADGGSQELHPGEVTGLATLPSGDALVLKPSGAFVRTGTLLRPNELSMSLPPSASLLRSEGSRLWFSTPAAIVRLDGASLTSFSVPAVGSLQGPVAGVMVAQAGDRLLALRERGASIELQSLSDEVSIVRAVPLRNGAFLASDESGLVSCREVQDGGALWRAVWVGDADAGAPLHGELLGVDPESGAAWLRVDGGLARLDEDRLAARPMESFTAFAVDTNGAVLLRTATGVVRLGSEAPVRFSDQVRPLSQARCVSCHRQSGVALPVLETAAQWREHIDTILLRVSPTIAEGLRMPRGDSALLEADLTRLRRWKQEGFRP